MSKVILSELSNLNGSGNLLVSSGTKFEMPGRQSYIQLPKGTTDERPLDPIDGEIRYNEELKIVEYFNGDWVSLETLSTSEEIIKSGLRVYLDATNPKSYPRTGALKLYDLSKYNNDGTILNNVTFDEEDGGGCFVFNGTNHKIITPRVEGMYSYTYEVVCKGGTGYIVYRNLNMAYNDNADMGALSVNASTGAVSFHVEYSSTDNDRFVNLSGVFGSDKFYHIVATYDWDTKTQKVYVDGILLGSLTNSAEPANLYRSDNFFVFGTQGYSNHGGGSSDRNFYNGRISSIKIYDRAITSGEVWNNYVKIQQQFEINPIPSIVTNGLVLNFDAANYQSYPRSGTSVTDLSGNGNDGTLQSSVVYDSSNAGNFRFNGDNTAANMITTNYKTTLNNFSLTAVFKADSPGRQTWEDFIDSYDLDSSDWCRIALYQGRPSFEIDAQSSRGSVTSPIIATSNQWYHITGVRNGSTGYLYLNGVLVASNPVTSNTILEDTDGQFVLGNLSRPSNPVEGLLGNIAYASIYNRALSTTEIRQNFNTLRTRYGI